MSIRAVRVGIVLALLVAMGGHFNDVYMRQTYMVGNHLPISVIGCLVFLVWGTYPINAFGTSFLIGSAVKALVVRFGGGSTFQKRKPLMVGIIAGDLLGGLIFMIAGAVCYAATGFAPAQYRIFPG